jgi:hypothetical protein
VRHATGFHPWMTLDGMLSGRPCSHSETVGMQRPLPLDGRVGYAAYAAAWTWTGTCGPTTWAFRSRGARRKRWLRRSRRARPNI